MQTPWRRRAETTERLEKQAIVVQVEIRIAMDELRAAVAEKEAAVEHQRAAENKEVGGP